MQLYTLRSEGARIYLGMQWDGGEMPPAYGLFSYGILITEAIQDRTGALRLTTKPSDGSGSEGETVHLLERGAWLVWERGGDSVDSLRVVSDTDVRAQFSVIELGDTELAKEDMRESRSEAEEFMRELADVMRENPDLPVEWIKPTSGDCIEWIGPWQLCDMLPRISIETIARGWRYHILVQGEDTPDPLDRPEELRWYRAIVVRCG